MQDLLLVGPALRLSDFLDLCRAAKPESVLFHPETTALRIKAINAAAADQLEAQAQGKAVDCLRLPAELSIQNVRLIALDMDSTLIANECIDDMAAIAGCGPEMARLTREAMEPENRGIYTQSDSSKKSSRNIWSLDRIYFFLYLLFET